MFLALVLSVAIGAALGLLGGGGSTLALPILLYVLRLETRSAIATSLIVVGATSLSAVLAHARAGHVRYSIGATFGAASMAGAFAGGHLARFVPSALLLSGFALMMGLTGIAMLRPPRFHDERTTTAPASAAGIALVGFLVGSLTGLVGAGGGFLVVPALAVLFAIPMPQAIGTSLLVIAMNALAGFIGQIGHTQIDGKVAALVTLAAVVGGVAGASLSKHVAPRSLRRAFGALVLAMAVFMALERLPGALRDHLFHDGRVTHLIAAVIGGALALLVVRLRVAVRTPRHPSPTPLETHR
jgi:uncharacterized protein